MTRFIVFLLFVLVPVSSVFADGPGHAGALRDLSEEDLVNIPCPAAMAFSVPENNKEMATIVGANGRVDTLLFELELRQAGVKQKGSGKCFYNVITKGLSVKRVSGEKIDVVQKESRSDEYAVAFRRSDVAGEQVVGLRVPLARDFYLSFSEVPLEAVYSVRENSDGGTEFVLKSSRMVANAKVRKKIIDFDPKTRVPRLRTENYGEVTLIVSIKE